MCEEEIDATGMCVMPGLVDAHTHPVWVGDRVHEFSMTVRMTASYCLCVLFVVSTSSRALVAELWLPTAP